MILDDIVKEKKREVEGLKEVQRGKEMLSLAKSLPAPRNFAAALKKGGKSIIAEIKKASPSAGIIRDRFDPVSLARAYEEAGVSAISVLTDKKFFQGDLSHLKSAKESTTIPILRKDFIIDESQIYESRISGADAILLIVRILTDAQIEKYLTIAKELKMSCLVEAHSEEEARRAYSLGAEIIGINNRDLQTFNVDINTSIGILRALPELQERIVVSESGISTKDDVKKLSQAGVDAFLVGESILKSDSVAKKIEQLISPH